MTTFARVEGDRWVRLDGDRAEVLSRAPWLGGSPTGQTVEGVRADGKGSVRLLAPVDPKKILCVGRNYRAHAKELGNEVPAEPMLFYKPSSSLLEPFGTIVLPPETISARVEHEAELAVVIGSRLKGASEEEALRAVFGLTIACDVTARDLQKKDGQWWRAKGMDTFCPVGPVLVAGAVAEGRTIECRVNDEVRQKGSTDDMIFSVARVLSHVSAVITLEPGDLVLTGTPEGVGPLVAGDKLRIEISGLGVLEAAVAAP